MAAVLVWFGASRIGEAPRQGERDERLDGVHDGGGRYRPDDDFRPGDAYRPAEGPPPASQYATYGQRPGRPQPQPPAQPVAQPTPLGQPPSPARPYGRIQIFTLLDDRAAEFDRLAEEAAELVSAGEPDTLVYVIHLVPNAPLQRIFYEVYRDRAAFDAHESQPYMQRFVAGRRSLVLATNVIELRLKYAKVAPLPNPQQAGPQQRPPVPAGPPRPQPRPPARPQPPRPEAPRSEPLRPEPERYDRQGYDQERYRQEQYEQERYDQRRPGPRPDQRPGSDQRPGPDQRPGQDPRQVPSAGRRYGDG
jgi:quinol monooxygenase YgiN